MGVWYIAYNLGHQSLRVAYNSVCVFRSHWPAVPLYVPRETSLYFSAAESTLKLSYSAYLVRPRKSLKSIRSRWRVPDVNKWRSSLPAYISNTGQVTRSCYLRRVGRGGARNFQGLEGRKLTILWGYKTLLCCEYFSLSSVVSRAFSALCGYSKFAHHPHLPSYQRANCFRTGSRTPGWISDRGRTPRSWRTLQTLFSDSDCKTTKIGKFSTIHLPILDQYVSRRWEPKRHLRAHAVAR